MKKIITILMIILIAFIANQIYAQEPIITRDPNPNPTYITYEEYMQNHPFEATEYVEVSRNFSNLRNGGYLIIIDSDILPDINTSISIYQEDLAEEGYNSYVIDYTGTTSIDMRDLIISYYQTEAITGVFLVGDLPVAWYIMYGDFEDLPTGGSVWNPNLPGSEEFPLDIYFSDIDGDWVDYENDGIFDDHVGNKSPEIEIGRIKADNMNLLEASESELINNYFQKNHTFRNEILFTNNALLYIDDAWADSGIIHQAAMQQVFSETELINNNNQTTASDYRTNRLSADYGFIQVHCHSGPTLHQFTENNGSTTNNVTSNQVSNLNPTAYFYNLFACKNSCFTDDNNMGSLYILGNNFAQGTIGTTKTGGMKQFQRFYLQLSLDKTLGEAFRYWWQQTVDVGSEPLWLNQRAWHYGMVIQGDPSLKVNYNDQMTIAGSVSLNGGNGSIVNTDITFNNSENNFTINPAPNGLYFHTFTRNEFGEYDITYELYSSNGDYYPITIEDYVINANTLNLPIIELHPITDPTFVRVSSSENIPAFRNIQAAVDYLIEMEIDGTIKIFPGIYNENAIWNSDTAHIKLSGVDQETCIIEGSISVVGFNSNENDIIENLTFRNTSVAITNNYNGLNTVQNNKFEYCTDHIVISNRGYVYAENGTFKLINNKFVNNNCLSAYYSLLSTPNPASFGEEIIDNVFENNTVKYPLLWFQRPGQLTVNDNTFKNNTYASNGSTEDGSILDILTNSIETTTCYIKENVFQNNRDVNALTNGVISIRNDPAWGCYDIDNNSFVGNNALSMIHYDANIPSNAIDNSIFKSNTIFGDNVINGPNLIYCDYSLFYDNNANNGNCDFGDNIFEEDPLLDENNKPLWNSTSKSPCIDTGYGGDPDGTPADIGAVRAVTHKYDEISLPSPDSESKGWKWLSFPALDDVYADADIAHYLLAEILDPTILDVVETEGNDNDIVFLNPGWSNEYEQFYSTQGFKFHMNEEATLHVPGFLEPPTTTIDLEGNQVENWIGYFLEDSHDVEVAFESIWDDLYFIWTQDWGMIKLQGEWYYHHPEDAVLEYGDMIIVKCENPHTFQWCDDGPIKPKKSIPQPDYFSYTEKADYTPIYLEFDPDDIPTEVGAFLDGECKGAAVVEGSTTQIRIYLEEGEQGEIELVFYYNNRSENKIFESYNCMTSDNLDIVMKQLSANDKADAWVVSFREESNVVPVPEKVTLSNYPNPFNPATTISYSLPLEGNVSLCIYNVKGQLVRQLIDGSQPEGYYEVVWNGKDNTGRLVASGIYYYQIKACGKNINKKMLMLK